MELVFDLNLDNLSLPPLDYFINQGIFTNGKLLTENRDFDKEMRCRILKEEDQLKVYVWIGPYCYEKSEIFSENSFPFDENGRLEAEKWLTDQYELLKSKA